MYFVCSSRIVPPFNKRSLKINCVPTTTHATLVPRVYTGRLAPGLGQRLKSSRNQEVTRSIAEIVDFIIRKHLLRAAPQLRSSTAFSGLFCQQASSTSSLASLRRSRPPALLNFRTFLSQSTRRFDHFPCLFY